MREIKVKKNPSQKVMQFIADNYNELYYACKCACTGKTRAKTLDDLFQDTFIFVAQDDKAKGLKGDELKTHFLYRFRMIQFQAVMEQCNEISYADYKETTKGPEQEDL